MSAPMSIDKLITQLHRWNLPFQAYKDWSHNNRGDRGNGWSDLRGIMIHHTGSDGTDQRELLYSGRTGLPGPLCHFGIDQKGTIHLVGWGRANHAGSGDSAVLRHVTNEDYTSILTPTKEDTDGNGYFYGIEIWYSGSHEMTSAQYNTTLKLCAAIAEHHKWSEKSAIGHGEWTPEKWDPGFTSGRMMNIANVRRELEDVIENGPVLSTPPPVDSPTVKTQTYREVWDLDSAIPPRGYETDENPTWGQSTVLRFAANRAEQAYQNTLKIMKHLGIE